MGPRMSKYGYQINVSPEHTLKAVLGRGKRSKAPVTLPVLIAPRIDAANPAPMRKVEYAEEKGQPKRKASKRKR